MIDDFKLSERFTFYQFTRTDHKELQEENRREANTETILKALMATAILLEDALMLLDNPDAEIHSAYRCPKLNQAVGSTSRSQHLLGQAVDWAPKGLALSFVFRTLQNAAKEGRIHFGQLIYESQSRGYGANEWIHLSLGSPWREASRCGQVLTMKDGAYQLVATV